MTLIDTLIAQGKRAFREPRQAAADVIALGLPREALAPALLLVVVLGVILNAVSELVITSPFQISYFSMAFLTAIIVVWFSFTIAKIGEMMGGIGSFPDALLLTVFFQAIFIPLQIAQLIMLLFLPVLAMLFGFAVMVLMFWVYVNFVAALHGYESLGRALGVFLLAAVAAAIFLALIAPFFGISIAGSTVSV